MEVLHKIKSYLIARYTRLQLISILILVILAFFVSDSSVFSRFSYDAEIRDLRKQIEFYREKSEADRTKLEQLKSNKENVEKFARENYLMKKDNEEVFVIEE